MNNVLFIHYGNDTLRGSEICLINLLKNLDRDIVTPYVLCNSKNLKSKIEELDVTAQALYWPEITLDGKDSKVEVKQFIRTLIYLIQFVRKKNVNLIYSNSGLPTQAGYIVSRIFRLPIITHVHAVHPKRYPWMWFFKFSDTVIFVSEFIKNDIINKVNFKGNVCVIHNGIDNKTRFCRRGYKDISIRQRLNIKNDEVVLAQVGEISYEKGCDILIRAFRELCKGNDKLKLIFIGEGKNKVDFVHYCESIEMNQKILFLGYVDEIEEYFKNVIDINVLASRNEALPLSLIEASSCCLPNVASDCGGIPEVVEDNVSGLLFRTGDALDLKEKLKRLILDHELRRKMGVNGRRISEERFGIDEYVKRTQEEILKLLNQT